MSTNKQRWCGLLEDVRATLAIQLRMLRMLGAQRTHLRPRTAAWRETNDSIRRTATEMRGSRQIEGCIRLVVQMMAGSAPAHLNDDLPALETSVRESLYSALIESRELSGRSMVGAHSGTKPNVRFDD